MTWQSKKQVVSLFSAKAEYRAMMYASFEMLWVCYFLQELDFPTKGDMPMYCDNQETIFLAKNPNFHERTKHIEIDCHDIHHQVLDGFITTLYVGSSHCLVYILTKSTKHGLLQLHFLQARLV